MVRPDAYSATEVVERLSRRDLWTNIIYLDDKEYTDAELAELVDYLLAHPDVVTGVNLDWNRLTDETGVKLARYVAASSTVECLSLYGNQLGPATYLALAAALQVNTSLRGLVLNGNYVEDKNQVDIAFIEALRANLNRPYGSEWYLYSNSNEFYRLRIKVIELGHPSLQLLLCAQLDHFTFQIKKKY
jgi:hypothetical protein